MEIIHVVLGKANHSRINGVNKVVHELATRQRLNGEQVSLWGITRFTTHHFPDRAYPTRLFKARRNPFALDRKLKEAVEKKGQGAIFHLHGGFIPAFYSLALLLYRHNIHFVFTPHGAYNKIALRQNRRRKYWYFRWFEKKILQYAGAIHCLGKSEMLALEAIFPNKKTCLIPYGFDSLKAGDIPVTHDKFIVGFCGRLDIYTKGLDLLLKAFSLLLRDAPVAELWIIGDSRSRKELEEMARHLGIRGQTVFYGSRFGEEKLDLLRQLNVFAHPSRNGGLPTAVLEAAALGIPCVITEATNVGDSVRQYRSGEVIAEPDGHLLGDALRRLYDVFRRKGLSTLSVHARQMISEGYDWNRIVGNFHQLYCRA